MKFRSAAVARVTVMCYRMSGSKVVQLAPNEHRSPRTRASMSGIAVVLPGGNLGYIVLSATMIAAALIELIWGVAAERRPLEDVARPLTFVK